MSELLISVPVNFAVSEAIEFKAAVIKLIEEGNLHVQVDFKECEFIDSTGIGVLVFIYKKLTEKQGALRLSSVNDQILRVLNLTRLDSVFDIIR